MARPRELFLRTDGHLREGWKAVLFLVLYGVLQYSVDGLVRMPGFPFFLDGASRLCLAIAFALLVSWLLLRSEGRTLADLGLRLGWRWGLEYLAGMAMGVCFMLGVALLILLSGGFHWELATTGGVLPLGSGAWLFLMVALREELVFRGYAFQRLVAGLGPQWALGLGSFGFACAHWGNPGMAGAVLGWGTLNIALGGAILGLCYLKTRSLAMPMGLHLAWNWTQGSLLGFGVSGISQSGLLRPVLHDRPDWLTGGDFGPEASLPCAALSIVAIVGLARWRGEAP